MKYAVVYNKNFKYLTSIDEILLYWSTKDDIISYVDEKYFPKQRIIITIEEKDLEEEFDNILTTLKELKEVHNNISVRFEYFTPSLDILEQFKTAEIRYFFNQFCSSWDILYCLASLGASDVYVTEELGFDLMRVSAFCQARKIKIRVYPNVAQTNGKYGITRQMPDIKKFFIRPEDTQIYNKFVDVFELWGNAERINILYEIYKQEQWLGNLRLLISDFNSDIQNSGFMSHFAKIRTNCRKKCLQGNRKCEICPTMASISKMMSENGFMIDTEKKELPEKDEINYDYDFEEEIDEEDWDNDDNYDWDEKDYEDNDFDENDEEDWDSENEGYNDDAEDKDEEFEDEIE